MLHELHKRKFRYKVHNMLVTTLQDVYNKVYEVSYTAGY